MANEFIDYHHSATCLWKWPMQVGILNPPVDIANTDSILIGQNIFASCKPFRYDNTHSLVIFNGRLEDIEKMMSIDIQADILILQVSLSFWDTDEKHKIILQQAKKLAKHTKSFSVLCST